MTVKFTEWLRYWWLEIRVAIRFFASMLVVVFAVAWFGWNSWEGAVLALGLNLLKEVVVDIWLRGRGFHADDFWFDMGVALVGAVVGVFFTFGSVL